MGWILNNDEIERLLSNDGIDEGNRKFNNMGLMQQPLPQYQQEEGASH